MAFLTTREIAAAPTAVFAAFEDSTRLARWWGPAGFTNTFEICEFEPDGRWKFVMHGPDGKHYPNESVFHRIDPPVRVVIQHVSQPKFVLTVTLASTDGGNTLVTWEQDFEDPRVASGVAHIVVPANEENLDRLSAEVIRSR